ncbi:MAG: inorganic phosphate transporter [Syntrophothermus sp.]
MFGLDTTYTIFLLACLLAALAFEFINGFHDTANAVATVIYTHSMKPGVAVVWAGIWNFIGVNVGGTAVAIGIINLLPTEILLDQNLAHNLSMILALIITAIIWNLATWYFGLPCSSSHTLIGSIFGVGIAYMLIPGSHSVALNWHKAIEVIIALFTSPVIGFGLAFLLMILLRRLLRKQREIFKEPPARKAPPPWIRSILVLTCTSVCFAHGSNDGQKGVGLIMLIMIAFAPAFFAIDRTKDPETLLNEVRSIEWTVRKVDTSLMNSSDRNNYRKIVTDLEGMKNSLCGISSFDQIGKKEHGNLRTSILRVSRTIDVTLLQGSKFGLSRNDVTVLRMTLKKFKSNTEYAPGWVILLVSLALGLGTMIGWKRIVVTIGEKIGKTHLTYAQGASAQLIAASTIWASSIFGWPVSTTHVLSSGIAGTMVAGRGRQNLQMGTVKSIFIAWVVTLPVTILMSGLLFLLLWYVMV